MHNQSRAQINRAAQVWRGRGVVDNQRNSRRVGNIGHRTHIHDIPARIGNRLAEDGTGVIVNRRLHCIQIVEIDESGGPAKAFDGLAELRDRATIKTGRGDDVLARPHQREQRHDLRRVSA